MPINTGFAGDATLRDAAVPCGAFFSGPRFGGGQMGPDRRKSPRPVIRFSAGTAGFSADQSRKADLDETRDRSGSMVGTRFSGNHIARRSFIPAFTARPMKPAKRSQQRALQGELAQHCREHMALEGRWTQGFGVMTVRSKRGNRSSTGGMMHLAPRSLRVFEFIHSACLRPRSSRVNTFPQAPLSAAKPRGRRVPGRPGVSMTFDGGADQEGREHAH